MSGVVAFKVWLAMFPTLRPVEWWKCAVSILCMGAIGSEESYEDESEEDEVGKRGGLNQQKQGKEQPNMSNKGGFAELE